MKFLLNFLETPLETILKENDGTVHPPATDKQLQHLMEHLPPILRQKRFLEQDYQTKPNYIQKFDLKSRSTDGYLEMIHHSSGSSGKPTFWQRGLLDEVQIASLFERIFKGFGSMDKTTLAVVCFPMGSWVGGLFTTCCLRLLSQKQYKLTTVTPGNNFDAIHACVQNLDFFDQIVFLGYPPFVKMYIDKHSVKAKFVLAGEVFSEEWRQLLMDKSGCAQDDIISIYGTSDAGVLGAETSLSIEIRRFLAKKPELAKELFQLERLPSLMQYDPLSRYFEVHPDQTLVFTTMPLGQECPKAPLVRYCIGDRGSILSVQDLLKKLKEHGFESKHFVNLPFVWVFGRAHWTISLFGANVYVENIMVGLEQPQVHDLVTGKFVLDKTEDRLLIRVECSQNTPQTLETSQMVAQSILEQLLRLNSEFANYVPASQQLPQVVLYPYGDSQYFRQGVKHQYIQ
ncbi:hypothetical protein EDD86DRAFT_199412 [Gorgonomyces haynaldii]|nr:hypothetical protein EDD86DRAFT_199412 [Gorgonomyces haynaldii]